MPKLRVVLDVVVGLALIATVVAAFSISAPAEPEPDAREARLGVGNRTHEGVARIKAYEEEEHGGEADREAEKTIAADRVLDRALPRRYVDDRLAIKVRRTFDNAPKAVSRSAFKSDRRYRAAAAATPRGWSLLGPRTPNVVGEASQFFDYTTLNGPPTQETGRVTALAIDPACEPGNCRLAVAAAGGGIWRTEDAMATRVQWHAPPDDLPTNAFGSLLYDAPSQTSVRGLGRAQRLG